MNFFKKLLSKSKGYEFYLEHFPLTGRYFIRAEFNSNHKGWLRDNHGIISIESYFDVCSYSDNPEKIKELINLFKEQKLRQGIIVKKL